MINNKDRKDSHDYGLELTQNSKVGWAFSLSRKESCYQCNRELRTLLLRQRSHIQL